MYGHDDLNNNHKVNKKTITKTHFTETFLNISNHVHSQK